MPFWIFYNVACICSCLGVMCLKLSLEKHNVDLFPLSTNNYLLLLTIIEDLTNNLTFLYFKNVQKPAVYAHLWVKMDV